MVVMDGTFLPRVSRSLRVRRSKEHMVNSPTLRLSVHRRSKHTRREDVSRSSSS